MISSRCMFLVTLIVLITKSRGYLPAKSLPGIFNRHLAQSAHQSGKSAFRSKTPNTKTKLHHTAIYTNSLPFTSRITSGGRTQSCGLLQSSTSTEPEESASNLQTLSGIDAILGRLTSLFPFFVLSASLCAAARPSLLQWVNEGSLISTLLALVMIGMGMTLQTSDFQNTLGSNWKAVPAGVVCQFAIMPLSALLVGKTVLNSNNALFLGLALVGCSPGGTASNLVSLIAGADVALSVLLTTCSTVLASVLTPLLVKGIVGSRVSVSGWALCRATSQVVLLPVALGMILNNKAPGLCTFVSRFTPFLSVLLVAIICGGVVAQNASLLGGMQGVSLPQLLGAVCLLHTIGFGVGYFIPRKTGFSERTSRTISIETEMQNSALAVVLARSIPGASELSCLPGALSATLHSCLGSILSAFWRWRDQRE